MKTELHCCDNLVLMKASELRVGNIILFAKGTKYEKARTVKVNYFRPRMLAKIYPADLTDEWLERIGFKNDDGSFILKDNIGEITRYYYDGWNMTFEFEFSSSIVYGIEYVHQLQNMYFALTGKELTWIK